MATVLHLGFNEVPHFGDKTADQVAEILEAKYRVVQTFYEMNEEKIVEALVESYAHAIDAIELGADPHTFNPAGSATSAIETMFRQSLGARAYDGVIPGVPTQASLRGHSVRRMRPRQTRASRASFRDSGIYESSFTAWVTHDDEE